MVTSNKTIRPLPLKAPNLPIGPAAYAQDYVNQLLNALRLYFTQVDAALREGSNISSRAFYYAGPDGALGLSHRNLKDAITLGHLDRILFVDYNRFCSTPKAQMKRIYEFLELPNYEHDFENIVQEEVYNDLANGLPNLHKIKPSLDKTTINCVDYLGLELYEQYNREIFWNAWI